MKISISTNREDIQAIEDSVNMLACELDRGVSVYGKYMSPSVYAADQQGLTLTLSQE